jgi:anaerobic selenocysteine-containing dehydrogenase
LQALDRADCVLVVGADLVRTHQVAGFLIKRNLPAGTTLIVIDPNDNQLGDQAHFHLRPTPGSDAALLQGLMSSLQKLGLDKSGAPSNLLSPDEAAEICSVSIETLAEAARYLGMADQPVILYGKGLTRSNALANLDNLHDLAAMLTAETLNLRGKANSMAAECFGLTGAFQPESCQAAYLALGDDYPTRRLLRDLESVPFLAVQASYVSPLTERADVVLPVEIWSEQEGSYLNMEGRLQWAQAGAAAPEGVRSNLSVIQNLASELGLVVDENWQDAILSALPEAALANV